MIKQNLKGLTLQELETFVVSIGEKKFRSKQLFNWIYTKEVDSFSEMSTLAKSLRDKLTKIASINSLTVVKVQNSIDGTRKFLLKLNDGYKIESVLIPQNTAFVGVEAKREDEQKRTTLCVSTQVGCPGGCKFCATASMGFYRNLTSGEIIDQLICVKKYTGECVTNLVFMGMGEPLLNYDNVVKAIEIITTGMAIAARRITLSTVGIVPQIIKIADEHRKFKLAISLHSLDQTFRESLIPIAKKYPVGELLNAVEYYYKKTKLRPTFEYILFDKLNDGDKDLTQIIKLSKRIPCKINVIPFNKNSLIGQNANMQLKPTSTQRMEEFVKHLRSNYVTVFIRNSTGKDINAACGQLVIK